MSDCSRVAAPRRAAWFFAFAVNGLVACASASAPQGITREMPRPAQPELVEPHTWRVAAPSEPVSYELDMTAVVSTTADTLSRVDTLHSRIELAVIPRGAALDVSIVRYDVRHPNGRVLAALDEPVRVLGRLAVHDGVTFEGGRVDACGQPGAAAVQATRDLWLRVPERVRVGDSWRDSTMVRTCRDGIWLTSVIVRDHRLVAAATTDSATTLTIARSTRMTLQGSGQLLAEPVEIEGTGAGSATLRVSTASGWVIDATGESRLALVARSPARTQTVDQTLVLRAVVTPRND